MRAQPQHLLSNRFPIYSVYLFLQRKKKKDMHSFLIRYLKKPNVRIKQNKKFVRI